MKKIKKKYFRVLEFALIFIIILELLFIYFNLGRPASTNSFSAAPPKSKTDISPFTGNEIPLGRRQPLQVTYTPRDLNTLVSGIGSADIVFEYTDEKGRLLYSAIFHDNPLSKVSPIIKIEDFSLKSLPELTFYQPEEKNYSNEKAANFIFARLSYNTSSNFIYEEGSYTHYRETIAEIDTYNYRPVSVANVIIQFTKNNDGIKNLNTKDEGKGMLFTKGKFIDIKWKNDGSRPIKIEDESGNPVGLMAGKTWWIIANENCPVAFN